MQLEGQEIFESSTSKIWKILTDPEVLAQIMPGGADLEEIDKDAYNIISTLKVGFIKLNFEGELHIINKDKPKHFTLDIRQKSKMVEVDVIINVKLKKITKKSTQVSYDGNIELTGMMSNASDRMVQPFADLIVKGFMRAMKERVGG